ncbi:hypothetical protein ACFO4M_28985 [Pseudonocardia nematodicida]|uniref:hypothetical protein n=1 Tax=Pseudonocardia nematodicida TaxID=1206997 RepID=UPI0036095635
MTPKGAPDHLMLPLDPSTATRQARPGATVPTAVLTAPTAPTTPHALPAPGPETDRETSP